MFDPVEIKQECISIEDVNIDERINASLDNSSYPLFNGADVEYKYSQSPQFLSHAQLSNEIKPKENDPTAYMKDYTQNGMTFQTTEEGNTNPNQTSQWYHVNDTRNLKHSAIAHEMQKLVNQLIGNSKTVSSTKSKRRGRPPRIVEGEEIKYQCKICFNEFVYKKNMFAHMKTHNGKRQHKCSQCEKCFTYRRCLAAHMRTHTGERPYGCQICGKWFSYSGNLTTHLWTHSEFKQRKHGICGKELRHSKNLSIQERNHSKIVPYECKVYGKEFFQSVNLTTHKKRYLHTIGTNASVNQCKTNEDSRMPATVNFRNSASLNTFANNSSNDTKVITNASNIVFIKQESNDEGLTNGAELLTSN
ncbi:uncharacterized protein LOC143209452 isoform X2 [Lasioglossum baleicum]|uniref:uncharacterized protein LOC143209452 isoform X2 n=1 Tax=Lasioglossum baleicum TaxID=434251 RepID=UPI003FCD4B66